MDDFDRLSSAFASNDFEPFIERIRFPYLKRIQPDTEIKFEYPITAIIGPNGTNKTTILRALESCPAGKSLSDYWFETSLDSIDTTKGAPRYIHDYRIPSGKIAEVMKIRVEREGRKSDYFETARPRKTDSMCDMPAYDPDDEDYRTKDRWRPIAKEVVYLDFRAQLPAYDILMNFNWRAGFSTLEKKKEWVRRTSLHLRSALDDLASSRTFYRREKLLSPAFELSADEVKTIGKILGKNYKRIRLVKHEFYNCDGWTAILDADSLEYSEAFAGSGEFAVTMLVHAVKQAGRRSLILLDEPETSLHPGAQRELMAFLAKETLACKHQVVMSTHSSSMIETLPDTARKLLAVDPLTGEIYLASSSASLEESFVRLGATHNKREILVEDRLAAEIVRAAARRYGDDFLQTIEVKALPGGAEALITRAAVAYAAKDDSCVILLDGDKRPSSPLLERSVADDELEEELHKVGIDDKHLMRNGGNGDKQEQTTKSRRRVLEWYKSHVGYLPEKGCPENLILVMEGGQPKPTSSEAKEHWRKIAKITLGKSSSEDVTSDEIFYVQQTHLAEIKNERHFNAIIEELREHGIA